MKLACPDHSIYISGS